MCAKNKNICVWREQAIIELSRRVVSIVACCHGAKLCAHAARDFRSQQYLVYAICRVPEVSVQVLALLSDLSCLVRFV